MSEEKKREEIREEDVEERKSMIAELLNEILGLDIRWEKLSLDELIELAKLFAEPEKLIKRLQEAQRKARERIENLKNLIKDFAKSVFKYWNGPLIRLLRRVVLEVEEERRRKSD